jgi:hypothetical protein
VLEAAWPNCVPGKSGCASWCGTESGKAASRRAFQLSDRTPHVAVVVFCGCEGRFGDENNPAETCDACSTRGKVVDVGLCIRGHLFCSVEKLEAAFCCLSKQSPQHACGILLLHLRERYSKLAFRIEPLTTDCFPRKVEVCSKKHRWDVQMVHDSDHAKQVSRGFAYDCNNAIELVESHEMINLQV